MEHAVRHNIEFLVDGMTAKLPQGFTLSRKQYVELMQGDGAQRLGLTAEAVQAATDRAGDPELTQEVAESGGAAPFLDTALQELFDLVAGGEEGVMHRHELVLATRLLTDEEMMERVATNPFEMARLNLEEHFESSPKGRAQREVFHLTRSLEVRYGVVFTLKVRVRRRPCDAPWPIRHSAFTDLPCAPASLLASIPCPHLLSRRPNAPFRPAGC